MSFITSPGVIFPPLTAGGVAYGTGSQAKVNTAGILGQYLISGGAGVPTFTNLGTFTTVNCTNLVSSGTLASSFTVTSGTAVPLTITNVGTGNSFVVEDTTNPDSSPFVIDSNGVVITGTTTSVPVWGFANGLQNWAAFGYTAQGRFSADAFSGRQTFVKSRSTSPGGFTVVQSGDSFGDISFAGADSAAYIAGARIEAFVDGTPGLNDMPGRLVFSTTADGASTPTERMRIDSAGNVGIGAAANGFNKIYISGTLPSSSTATRGIEIAGTIPSGSTAQGFGFYSALSTQAAAFTLTTLEHFRSDQGTIGATSAVTTQVGFKAASSLIGATNNYGVYSEIASGTNRFNFYAAGTAQNYFGGVTTLTDPALTPLVINSNGATDATRGIAFDVGSVNFGRITVPAGSGGALAFWSGAGGSAAEKLRLPAATSGAVLGNATAIPAGGTAGFGYCATSTANFGVFFGSGAPTLSAAKGSLYLRSDGTTINDRMYVNTNGSTTWTNVVTAA